MSKKRKHRKYIANPLAVARVLARSSAFTADEVVGLEIAVRTAFENMRTGQGTEDDFSTLANAVNIAMVRGETIDALCVQTAQIGQDALMRCLDRHKRTGRWGFDGPGIADVEVAIDLYEQMLELSTPLQMMDAMRITFKRMQAGQVLTTDTAETH